MNKFLIIILTLLMQQNAIASTTQSVDEANQNSTIDWAQIIRSIALIYTDDKLDPEVEKFLNYKPEVIWEDNAYVYLWGMDIKTDKPYETGREILEKLLKEDEIYDYEKHPYDSSFLANYPKIKLPKNNLLCKKTELDCINKIISSSTESIRLVKNYQHLIKMYKRFTNFKHFKLISSSFYESPIASYRILIITQQLFHLSILNNIDKNHNLGKRKLFKELTSLRAKLVEADSLIAKMIIAVMIAENVEFLNILQQNKLIKIDKNQISSTLAPLTLPELSIYKPLYHEHFIGLRMVYDTSTDIERLNTQKYNLPTTLPLLRILAFIVFKPNLAVNTQYFNVVKKLFFMSRLLPREFYQKYDGMAIEANQDPIRNYYARAFLGNPSINLKTMYLEYQARLYDLDMKIQLLHLIIQSNSIDNLNNESKHTSSFDQTEPYKKGDKLCYSGLVKRNEDYRCLLILK